jgi:hypothetical protein
MYASVGDWPNVARWGAVCRRLCPDRIQYSSFWPMLARAALAQGGLRAAREVLDDGLRHHPGQPDLCHARLSLDAIDWLRASLDPGAYLLASQQPAIVEPRLAEVQQGLAALGIAIHASTQSDGPMAAGNP